jgi:hypothetical protein
MDGQVPQLRQQLLTTEDPEVVWHCVDDLLELAEEPVSRVALEAIATYVVSGRLSHLRPLVLGQFVTRAPVLDASWSPFFREQLEDPALRYWSIVGYSRSAGVAAYPDLVALAADASLPVMDRACAVKQLALHSRQPFDRGLPADPGHWRAADLRLDEVGAWAADGYLQGSGYSAPVRHPALDQPRTPFEQIVARLDRFLAQERAQRQDPANPSDWLAVADPADITTIQRRWRLPARYLDFLTRFSPVEVALSGDRFVNWLHLYGARDLVAGQQGYAWDHQEQPLPDWPAHLLVIGHDGGDPYVLDLAQAGKDDGPVYTAMEGSGEWNWVQVAASFQLFLKTTVDALESGGQDQT